MGFMKSIEIEINNMASEEGRGIESIDDDRRFFHITYIFREISRKKLSDMYEDKNENNLEVT